VSPFTDLFVAATSRGLALFGLRATRPGLTEDDLKSVFNLGADEGVIHGEERRRLHKVIEFGDKTVRDIMVPRTRIVALPETASFRDVRLVLTEHKLSRLPIYRGNLDNIVGILRAKDLFDVTDEEEIRFDLQKYVHPPLLAPQFKPAEVVFREMRRRRTHMAIVMDEFGGTAGLVTLEDAIEELLGPIQDEYDEETPGFAPAGDHAFLLDGGLRLEVLAERFGIDLPRDEADTIAGHLMLRFGRIPRKGERWKGRAADFVVEEATPTTIKKVKMILPETSDKK
jgi:putative hemolysin